MATLQLGHTPAPGGIVRHGLLVGVRGEQQRASPSSPHTEHWDFWRKGKRRNQEVSQKRCREGQGMVAPMVMDS